MKNTRIPILLLLALLLPLNALAHPGHENGAAPADTGFSSGQLWSLSALAGLALPAVAIARLRHRKTARVDD